MYKLITPSGKEFTIPKKNIKLLAWQKAMDIGVISGNVNNEETAIKFLEEVVGIKVEELKEDE